VIWDKAAPLEWDFAKFNADESAAYAFLEEQGARTVTVPYRANRAVIFDSNLFHKTTASPLRRVMRTGVSTSPCCMGAAGAPEELWRNRDAASPCSPVTIRTGAPVPPNTRCWLICAALACAKRPESQFLSQNV
jgi:hypothetical protein